MKMCVCDSGQIADFKVAASRGTQPRHKPRIVDGHIASLKIATQRRFVVAAGAFELARPMKCDA